MAPIPLVCEMDVLISYRIKHVPLFPDFMTTLHILKSPKSILSNHFSLEQL